MFSFNTSLVLLGEGACRNLFAYLSTVKDCQYFVLSLLAQSLTALLEIPIEMKHYGSGPIKGHLDPNLSH
jgi:hypothetical protein